MDWPSIKQDGKLLIIKVLDNGTWPPLNPNWFK